MSTSNPLSTNDVDVVVGSTSQIITIKVLHSGTSYDITLTPTSPLSHLKAEIQTSTLILPQHQKIIFKGKTLSDEGKAIGEYGLDKDGVKVTLLGSLRKDIEKERKDEDLARRREESRRKALENPYTPYRATNAAVHTISTLSDEPSDYFSQIAPLPTNSLTPHLSKRREFLERLSSDRSILHIMKTHDLRVGTLTELHPLKNPELLGLNTNAGQIVSLRILTDDLDGTRPYNDVRRVLVHELAHNRFGGHENDFKEFNSLMNKELARFEASSKGRRLEEGEVYQPVGREELELYADKGAVSGTGNTLGGSGSGGAQGPAEDETMEDRRRRTLEAIERRTGAKDGGTSF